MKRGAGWLAGLLLGGAAWGAEVLAPAEVAVRDPAVEKETPVHALARDTTGAIWGISREKAGEIYLRGDGVWKAVPVPGAESLRPQAIDETAKGTALCLWLSSDGAEGAFSQHRGVEKPILVSFVGKLREPRLLVCADGNALVTESGPTVVTFDAAEKAAQVQTMPDTLFRPATKGEMKERNYAPTRAVQDAAGRRWLWSFALDASDYQWRLSGLVRMGADGAFEPFVVAGLAAADRISDVLPTAADQLWVAKVGDGLWAVDTADGQAAPLPEASFTGLSRKAFSYVEEMRESGGARYVITCPRPTQFDGAGENAPRIAGRVSLHVQHFYDQRARTGGLFRQRDGKWKILLGGLDENPRFGNWKRPWAQSPETLFIGATGSGPWVLPKDAKASPVLLDWQQHFPFGDVADFGLTAKGEILCLSRNGETALVPSQPDRQPAIRQVTVIKSWERIWRDARGHLWSCDNPLKEWDGQKWNPHPYPREIVGQGARAWLADDRDRGWILYDSDRVAICDFATAQWQVFESVESALQAQLPAGVRLPDLDDPYLDPAFSGDGRCALFRLPDRLSYFDGEAWHHWTTREIAGESAQVNGGPYFDGAGKLCFSLGSHVRQWDAATGMWIAFSDPLGPQPSTRAVEPSVEMTMPSPIKDPASVARDDDGLNWIMTGEGELKKLAPGVIVPAFFAGEPHPFRAGMKVVRALIDARGNAWLELSDFGQYHRYVYVQGVPRPDTQAELLRVEGDTAVLRFTVPIGKTSRKTGATSSSLFSWQLDGGPWQRVMKSPDLTLESLAAGRHRLLVRAYGPSLSVDPTPAVVEWQIDIDPEAQRRALLTELSAPTLARREAAAKVFREQGEAALPFLKKARETAPEELRWWIDAIQQQISPRR